MIWSSNTKPLAHIKTSSTHTTTTNARDVSRTNIYRANSPTMYARVMKMNSLHTLSRLSFGRVSTIDSTKQDIINMGCMRGMKGKTLKHKPNLSVKPFP